MGARPASLCGAVRVHSRQRGSVGPNRSSPQNGGSNRKNTKLYKVTYESDIFKGDTFLCFNKSMCLSTLFSVYNISLKTILSHQYCRIYKTHCVKGFTLSNILKP